MTLGLFAMVGILFFACDNGTNGGNEPPPPSGTELNSMAIGANSVALLLSNENVNRSVMVRSLVINNIVTVQVSHLVKML